MKCAHFVVIIILCVIPEFSPQECHASCECHGITMRCHGDQVPSILPEQVREVYFTHYKPFPENVYPFGNSSWRWVEKLDLTFVYPSENLFLARKAFTGLDNLQYLGIHGIKGENPEQPQQFDVYPETLEGLENLTTLNMSGNPLLKMDPHVLKLLKLRSIVPMLENIDITNLQELYGYAINMNSYVFYTLSYRPIKVLRMDNTSIQVDIQHMSYFICDSLEELYMRHVIVNSVFYHWDAQCPLKILDITNAQIPFLEFALCVKISPDWFNADSFNSRLGFLLTSTELYWNRFQEKCEIKIENGNEYDIRDVIINTKVFEFNNNNLQWFNASYLNPSFPRDSEISLTGNGLQYINPNCLIPGDSIRKLNLANNKLYVMEKQYWNDFAILMNTFPKLEEINLSQNQLTNIPENFFNVNDNLTTIILSQNNLKSVSFTIKHLIRLQYLDLRGNKIHILNNQQRNAIDYLYNLQVIMTHQQINLTNHGQGDISQHRQKRSSQHSQLFTINLHGNAFQCSCTTSASDFMNWMEQSNALYRDSHEYECEFEGETYFMDKSGLSKISDICHFQQAVKLGLITGVGVLIMISVIIGMVIIIHRRQLKQKKIKQVIRDIQADKFRRKFLVFLSYSSDDTKVVFKNIYSQLNSELCSIIGTTRDFVCISERHFRPGFPIISEMMSRMEESEVVICVMSRTYCQKNWCQMEVKESCTQNKPIILLFIEEVPLSLMSSFMLKVFHRYTRSRLVVTEDGSYEAQPSWSVISSSILELAACKQDTQSTHTNDVLLQDIQAHCHQSS